MKNTAANICENGATGTFITTGGSEKIEQF